MKTPVILLVENEPFFLSLLKDFLRNSPVTVLTATEGKEALRIAREQKPNLIYMNLRLPDMDGMACCEQIKGDSDLRSIPVIMMVKEGKEHAPKPGLAAGCDGVITKPVDRREFLEAGRRFIPQVERRHPRVRCAALAVFNAGGSSFHGSIEDISFRGVYVVSRCNIEIEDRIRLGFFIPGSDLIETDARVAWVNQGHRRVKPVLPEGFGVEFLSIAPNAFDQVKRFIASTSPHQ